MAHTSKEQIRVIIFSRRRECAPTPVNPPAHPIFNAQLISYTFNAFTLRPITIATHSPGAVERPFAIAIPDICGLQHKLLTSDGAEYASTGSTIARGFLDDAEGVGEDDADALVRGELAPRVLPLDERRCAALDV